MTSFLLIVFLQGPAFGVFRFLVAPETPGIYRESSPWEHTARCPILRAPMAYAVTAFALDCTAPCSTMITIPGPHTSWFLLERNSFASKLVGK